MDAASVYYRSRPFMLGSGLTLEEAFASDMARPGGLSGGRDVGVVFNMPRRGRAIVLPMAGDVGSQFTPAAGWAQAHPLPRGGVGQAGACVAAFPWCLAAMARWRPTAFGRP